MTNRRYFTFVPREYDRIHPLINFMLMAGIGFGAIIVMMHMVLTGAYITDGFLLIIMVLTWLRLYRS